MADVMSAAPPHLNWSAAHVGGALCLRAPGFNVRELNTAFAPVEDPEAVLAHYDGQPHIVCGGPQPAGYEPGYGWMLFERDADADATAETDLTIEQVGPHGALEYARVIRTGFGMPEAIDAVLARLPGRPGWTCLVAYDGADAVGAGALFIHGDEGYLGLGATLPAARGRGAQSAILAARVALTARAGARRCVTLTGAGGGPSYRNILRAGFEAVGERPNWDSASPASPR